MPMWKERVSSTSNPLEGIERAENLKVIQYVDPNLQVTIAIDLNTLDSFVLKYNERIK